MLSTRRACFCAPMAFARHSYQQQGPLWSLWVGWARGTGYKGYVRWSNSCSDTAHARCVRAPASRVYPHVIPPWGLWLAHMREVKLSSYMSTGGLAAPPGQAFPVHTHHCYFLRCTNMNSRLEAIGGRLATGCLLEAPL